MRPQPTAYPEGRRDLLAVAGLSGKIRPTCRSPRSPFDEGGRAETQTNVSADTAKNGYVEANGVSYYYEIHGEGEPLLLLHGGLGSIDMFGPVLSILAESRQVIGVDLHGHGRTALGDRPISLIDMGDDMAVIVKELGHDQVEAGGE